MRHIALGDNRGYGVGGVFSPLFQGTKYMGPLESAPGASARGGGQGGRGPPLEVSWDLFFGA